MADESVIPDAAPMFPFRRSIAIVIAGCWAIAMTVWAITSIGVLSAAHHTSQSQDRQYQASKRSDCKTQYSSILAKPTTERDNQNAVVSSISSNLSAQQGAALLAEVQGVRPTAAVIAQYAATESMLNIARDKLAVDIVVVNQAPSLNQASTKGFTWHGVHYPACPVVSTP